MDKDYRFLLITFACVILVFSLGFLAGIQYLDSLDVPPICMNISGYLSDGYVLNGYTDEGCPVVVRDVAVKGLLPSNCTNVTYNDVDNGFYCELV